MRDRWDSLQGVQAALAVAAVAATVVATWSLSVQSQVGLEPAC